MAGKARYSRTHLFGIVAVTAVVTSVVVGGGLVLAGAGPTPNKYYACAKSNAVVSSTIKVNTKPKCPSGQKLVVWNQVGPKGATGVTGSNGATGATGTQGPGGLPQLGTFTATQIVQGAILTCSSPSTTDCNFPKLNGQELHADDAAAIVDAICAVVRGGGWSNIGYGASSTATRFFWDGSKWVANTYDDQFINYIQCD